MTEGYQNDAEVEKADVYQEAYLNLRKDQQQ